MTWPTMAAALAKAAITSLERSPEEVVARCRWPAGDAQESQVPSQCLGAGAEKRGSAVSNSSSTPLVWVATGRDRRARTAPSGKLIREIEITAGGAVLIRASKRCRPTARPASIASKFAVTRRPSTCRDESRRRSASLAQEPDRARPMAGRRVGFGRRKSPIELRIEATSDRTPVNYSIADANGKSVAAGSLFKPRGKPEARIMLDPANHPMPWRLEVVGWRRSLARPGCNDLGTDPRRAAPHDRQGEAFPKPGDPNRK